MPKFIRLRVEGSVSDVVIEADTVEESEDEQEVVLRKGTTVVGKFAKRTVIGWWITESPR